MVQGNLKSQEGSLLNQKVNPEPEQRIAMHIMGKNGQTSKAMSRG